MVDECALMVVQVDRKKLKSDKRYEPNWTAAAGPEADEEFAEPASELERQLQAVWQEVLAQDAISVTRDFFQLGGTSLRVPPIAILQLAYLSTMLAAPACQLTIGTSPHSPLSGRQLRSASHSWCICGKAHASRPCQHA